MTHLQTNLSEIYAALQAFYRQPNAKGLSLYATFSSRLYFQGCLTGQIIKIWDKIWAWIQRLAESLVNLSLRKIFKGEKPKIQVKNTLEFTLTKLFDHAVHHAYDARQRRIWNNMREIDQIWKNTLQSQDFAGQRNRYIHYLLTELKGSVENNKPIYLIDFDERPQSSWNTQERKTHRHTILNFHQTTHFFWSLFIKDKKENQDLSQPLMHLIQPSSSTLIDRALFKALKKEEMWVRMEGIMQQSIPVALFAKLEDPKNLTIDENQHLQLWVQTLNQCQHLISHQLLYCMLSEVINVIHLQGSSALTLPDLLVWLDQQGCQLLHQEDPSHMDWREKLRPGDTIDYHQEKLVLGKQLSPNKWIDDTFKVFELKNYPDYVVKIAHNRWLLLMEAQKTNNEQEHWGVRLVKIIDPILDFPGSQANYDGRCVVLEKLSAPLDRHIWTSQELKLAQKDERIALVFANHIFCMSQWHATSQDLSLSHLMWDKEGLLKSTRFLKKGDENYNDLEAYCEKAAKGNLHVLSFLMNVSQLIKHKMALYYRKAVEYTLETGKTDLIGRPLPLGYRQEIYDQHIKQLCAQAQELRQRCFKSVVAHLRKKGQYSYHQERNLREAVANRLVELYRISPTSGRFSSDLEQRVIESFTKNPSVIKLLTGSLDTEEYYQEKYQQMMEYNRFAFSKE